jgi:hypothetical protein
MLVKQAGIRKGRGTRKQMTNGRRIMGKTGERHTNVRVFRRLLEGCLECRVVVLNLLRSKLFL